MRSTQIVTILFNFVRELFLPHRVQIQSIFFRSNTIRKWKKNCLMRNNMQQNVILLLYYFFDWPFREKFVFEGIEAERFWREWSQGMVNLSKKWKGRFWGDNILFSGTRSYVVYFDQPMGAPQAVRWVDRLLCRFNGTRVMLTSSLLFYILFSHKMSQKITKKHIIKGV